LLRQLIRAGKAGELVARGMPGGFYLAMQEGLDEQLLGTQRGGMRKFKHLDALAFYLQQLGASRFTVEVEHWADEALNV
jgi:hypothetical protein